MKTIGLLGGMSWQSTQTYYQLINEQVALKKGGLHSAKVVMVSVDFDPVAKMQSNGQWQEVGALLANSARQIEAAGADCLLICTNTMHMVADQVQSSVSIPLLHIADATGQKLVKDGIQKVALLGTAFTMQNLFYKQRINDKFGIEVITPDASEQGIVHKVIYDELCLGKIEDSSRQAYTGIVDNLKKAGAEAVILGCTEIGLLLKPGDTALPLYDTALIHAHAAVEFAVA